MPTIDVDGRTVAYRRAGQGPPLMFLHGGYSDGREWQLQLDALADEFDVIAWDAPGCGGSQDPPAGITMAGYADTVAALAAALDLDRLHLCGLSFGGGLALAVHAHHPELIRSLVLVSAYAGWRGSLPPGEVTARIERARVELDQPPEEWVDNYLPELFAGPIPPERLALVRSIMLDIHPTGVLPMVTAFAACDLTAHLPTIDVPVLLVHGAADVRAPLRVGEQLRRSIAASELVVLPGVGHLVHLEAPDRFQAEVRRFLRHLN